MGEERRTVGVCRGDGRGVMIDVLVFEWFFERSLFGLWEHV